VDEVVRSERPLGRQDERSQSAGHQHRRGLPLMVFKTIPRDRVIHQVELDPFISESSLPSSEASENCYSMEMDEVGRNDLDVCVLHEVSRSTN
jgi:hypothetical protein